MKISDLIKRIDQLISQGNEVLQTRFRGKQSQIEYVNSAPMAGSATLSFIERVYGTNHPHYSEFIQKTTLSRLGDAERAVSILQAIRAEIEGGWLFSLKALVAAELFSDFLDMAEYLMNCGYKDPAAVMIGAVLEEHLRQLCKKNSIDIDESNGGHLVLKKADRLNSDLAKADVYNKLDQKQITAWLDLRNKAAHGNYKEYTNEQVKQFMTGVVDFMVRVAL